MTLATEPITEEELRRAGLSHMPTRLMLYLVRHASRVCKREDIFRDVWGMEPIGTFRTLDVNIVRLRKWLKDNPGHGRIQTYRHFGYRYLEEEPA